MPSKQAKMVEKVIRLLNYKENLAKALLSPPYRNDKAMPKKSMLKSYDIKTKGMLTREILILKPKENVKNVVVLYLHGGAYLHGFQSIHWTWINHLLKQTHATIIAPDYPLIPKTVNDAYDLLIPLYESIIEDYPNHKIIIMGDSAGGGLALGLTQVLVQKIIQLPDHIILLSPWLDVTLEDLRVLEIDKKDPILNINALKKAGKLYQGTLDLKDPKLSPIYGNFKNFPGITVFSGTHDLLYPNTLRLIETLGDKITTHLYEEMMHVWMFFGLPESKKALKEVIDIIHKAH
ncbi:MAG: alpha/beta hydrolase [Acholeplasmataceae bacterium]|nr:alpha/beta hydrolase [Acholeplasmataceae bacterium]